jgi:hypothetical protein
MNFGKWKFGFDKLPLRLLLAGLPGSGKTAIFKALETEMVLSGAKLLKTDNADESVDFFKEKVKGKNIPVRAISMKYADGVGLNIGHMLKTAIDIDRFAWKVIPAIKGEQAPFWTNGARMLFKDAIIICQKFGGEKMYLADAIRIALNPPLHTAIAQVTNRRDPYLLYGENNARRDMQVTLATKLEHLAIFAATDLRCKERITLPLDKGILIIEIPDRFTQAMSGVTSFIYDWISDELLSRQSMEPVVFSIDEFRDIEALECIGKIARRGRKSGLSLLLSMHEIGGIYERYQQNHAEELMGLMNHIIGLRIGSPMTAKWLSEYMGATEELQQMRQGGNNEISRSIVMRNNVLPDELRRLPLANYAKDEITGWADFPDETFKFTTRFKDAVTLAKTPTPRQLRPDSDQDLPLPTKEDLQRINIPITPFLESLL